METKTKEKALLCESLKEIRETIDMNIKNFKTTLTVLKNLETQVRSLEKKYTKIISKKKKVNNGTVPGFLKPNNISNELRDFMLNNYKEILGETITDLPEDSASVLAKKDRDRRVTKELMEIIPTLEDSQEDGFSKIPRARVTQFISRYIKFHNIQKETNKTFVDMDTEAGKKLGSILKGRKEGEEVTFYNISKYTTHHFLKNKTKTIPDSESEEEEIILKPVETRSLKEIPKINRKVKTRKLK